MLGVIVHPLKAVAARVCVRLLRGLAPSLAQQPAAGPAAVASASARPGGGRARARVLVLAPQPYYLERGTPIDVDLLVRALGERGHEVDLVTYHEGRDQHHPGVTLHRIRAPRWLADVTPGFSGKKLVCDLLLLAKAWAVWRRRRPDVVHAGEEAVFIALALRVVHGTPYVYDMDSSLAQQLVEQMPALAPASRPLAACERVAIRRSLAAAPVCDELAALARDRGAPHVQVLHDISQLRVDGQVQPGQVRAKAGLADDDPVVMYVGNFEPYQGLDLLLAAGARARARGARFHLVLLGGTAGQARQIEAQAAAMGIDDRVHCVGPWPLERLHEALVDADVLVVPRTRGVNTPMKVFPFLHSGKPVLATDLRTHTQILDTSIAMLAPPEADAFAAALTRLLGDRALREQLGAAGRRFVEANHTYAAHRQRVDQLYAYIEARCLHAAAPEL
ncbi:MAG: glycosyltransferase family 4 protein [Phycisphaeraceae bacterium]